MPRTSMTIIRSDNKTLHTQLSQLRAMRMREVDNERRRRACVIRMTLAGSTSRAKEEYL